jgi:hypothetical protein
MRLSRLLCAVSVCLLAVGTLSAANFSFTGIFGQDDQLEVFLFSNPSGTVTLRTWSYAGGTNAAGQVIPSGGFDPVLSLYDATGGLNALSPLIDFNNDGPGVATDPATGNAFDSLITILGLNPVGTYALVLSENDNIPAGGTFGDGFTRAGQGNFTSSFGCGGPAFCDVTPAQRNGNWAVDILGVRTATDTNGPTVPEPGSMLLLGAGMTALAVLRRRRLQA